MDSWMLQRLRFGLAAVDPRSHVLITGITTRPSARVIVFANAQYAHFWMLDVGDE